MVLGRNRTEARPLPGMRFRPGASWAPEVLPGSAELCDVDEIFMCVILTQASSPARMSVEGAQVAAAAAGRGEQTGGGAAGRGGTAPGEVHAAGGG